MALVPLLACALQRVRSTPPRVIASPPTQPRRAAVALLIRIVPAPTTHVPPDDPPPPDIHHFFRLPWVNDPNARPEILFLRRDPHPPPAALPHSAPHEAHVAFPGGRTEPDDEGPLYTAMRHTWEEIGIDLAERHYACIGQLDDREITTSLGKRLLMILTPYVFLQLTPHAPPPDPIPSTVLHWTPLAALVDPQHPPKWTSVSVDAASRLAPRNNTALRLLVRILIGTMQYPAILLPPDHLPTTPNSHDALEKGFYPASHPHLKLWGLSLGMVLDLMSYMIFPHPTKSILSSPLNPPDSPLSSLTHLPYQHEAENLRMDIVAPSLASVFPRFSYPDVNFWIWVFGKRYRDVVRGWEESVRSGGTNDRRINWSGSALSTFYTSVRKALIIVFVGRALGIICGFGFAIWWLVRH